MIITRAPYRISFFGGGSDYEAWFKDHGGRVLTSTINKYCYLSARYMPPFLGSRYRIMWSKMENVDARADIQHAGVRGCLEYLGIDAGFEVNHAGDLPARSGLGSSSAFTVAMLNALHALNGEHRTPRELAREAVEVEQRVLRETVGIQDQIECAHGGLNVIEIDKSGAWRVNPVVLPDGRIAELRTHLMLFFTGLQRHASEIAAAQIENVGVKAPQLNRMMMMVEEGVRVLTGDGELDFFGELLHEGWMLKRGMSELVTTPEIDSAYERARGAGAIGGKLLGAGGGGFMLVFVKPHLREAVRLACSELIEVPFEFEADGSRVIFIDR